MIPMPTTITNAQVTYELTVVLAKDEQFPHATSRGEERIVTKVEFKYGRSFSATANKVRKNGQPYETGSYVYLRDDALPGWLAERFEQYKVEHARLSQLVADAVKDLP